MAKKSQNADDFEKNLNKEYEFNCFKQKESAVNLYVWDFSM